MHNSEILNNLLLNRSIWRGSSKLAPKNNLPTGNRDLDALLTGGWPKAELVELVSHQEGIGELNLLLPTLENHTQNDGLCVLLDPPYQLYAPAWEEANINLKQVLIVRSQKYNEWLWTAETVMRNGSLLLAWAGNHIPRYSDLRKLKIAALDNQQHIFLFNHINTLSVASPAALRLEIYSAKLHELIVVVRKLKGEYGGESIHIKQIGAPIKHIPLNKLLAPVYSSFPEKYLSLKQDGSEKNISNI